MVRYYEFNKLNESIDEREQSFLDLFRSHVPWIKGENYTFENGEINTTIPCWPSKRCESLRLPFKFGSVAERFHCDDMGIISLEGCPRIVIDKDGQPGSFDCPENNLKTLDFLPERLSWLKCSENDLENLGVLDPTKVNNIVLSYSESLPLLKLLLISDTILFHSKSVSKDSKKVLNIIEKHREIYSNINERTLRCKIALSHAGYESNAKW